MFDLLVYMSSASLVVQFVFLVLIITSVVSWAIIIDKFKVINNASRDVKIFEQQIDSKGDIASLYADISAKRKNSIPDKIFISGYMAKRYNSDALAKRAMQIVEYKATHKLSGSLVWLATIGSTSPYVGLFGTVWGIIHAFSALANIEQASLAMVAPGISEALVATALGLFVAIPAVIAFNKLTNQIEVITEKYAIIQEEILQLFALKKGSDAES